jgi:hypothetical protein
METTREKIIASARADMKDLTDSVREEWTANDGGLTWAASDVLHVASGLEDLLKMSSPSEIKEDLEKWEEYLQDGRCDSGTEADVVNIILATGYELLKVS